ncbi:MAG: hypothetical protein AMJ68_00440 [Acidithiobacillales bacterium SG8_45]|jgi:hypothetical protein|nr:MAG: hypothetical protein AMJ68_00440 [Acidithiobacillales bacterium SG8_45]
MRTNKFSLETGKALVAVTMLISAVAIAGPPAQSGVVERFEAPDFGVIVDQKAGVIAVLGFDPVEFCSGAVDNDIVAAMLVDIQADPSRIAIFAKGEYRTSVWDFVEFDCGQFLGELPLAVGMATVKLTDNDFFVSSAPNSNAYGFSAQGTLHDAVTGAPRRLTGVFRAIWDKEANEAIVKNSKVTLR